MAGKFTIRSRKWDIGILVGCLLSLVVGLGGLYLLQSSGNSTGTTTNLFVILLGVLTFAAFAGPGIVYVLRTGIGWAKLPGELGYGSGWTCWRRLREWQDAGVWDEVHRRVLGELARRGQLDWSRVSLDSVSVRAKRGAT